MPGAIVPWLAALENYLDGRHVGPGRGLGVSRLGGGQSNPTWLLEGSAARIVLRRKPEGALLPSAHAIDREFRVLRALHGSPVPVPRPLEYCADAAVIGTEFYLMEYVPGRVYWDGTLPEVAPVIRARIYDEMNRVLAALHELDPQLIGLDDYGRPVAFLERQIRRWTAQYRASEIGPRPDMEWLIDWLPEHVPADDGQAGLVHGDFRLDNLVFDDTGRALALLDWELSTLGHPYADLAYQCALWRLPAGTLRGLAGVDRHALGLPDDDAYVAAYLARRARRGPIPGWRFHLALGLFRLASICQGVLQRGLAGNASDPHAHEFGPRIDLIAREAVSIAAGGAD